MDKTIVLKADVDEMQEAFIRRVPMKNGSYGVEMNLVAFDERGRRSIYITAAHMEILLQELVQRRAGAQ